MPGSDATSKGTTPRIRAKKSPWGDPPPGVSDTPPAPAAAPVQAATADRVLIGRGTRDHSLLLKLANRHGLVAGATGTGKTVTLQVLAEGLSAAGIPVFAADIKGDLSGIAAPGQGKDAFVRRAAELGLSYAPRACPTVFWDVFGKAGHPVRATVSEMGPLLLSRLLELNDTQEGILAICFKVADEAGWPVVDLKDLRALLQFVSDNSAEIGARYGNVAKSSVAAVQRQLLVLEGQGADSFLGEPALDLHDFLRTDAEGRGIVNILAADALMTRPRLYATFLVWLLSELFEVLPEVGDLPKPKLVFFFDEAHLLFNDAPKALLDAVQGVVRLIRSKGVGVYFVTQNPLDVPDAVLGQLGNKVQHALRAFTPRDQKAVRAAAETFRQTPGLDTATAITELAVGDALISALGEGGVPEPVERALVAPPMARVGPLTGPERQAVIAASPLGAKYGTPVDRESAYEMLAKRRDLPAEPAQGAAQSGGGLGGILDRITETLGSSGIPVGGSKAPGGAATGSAPKGGRPPMSLTELVIRSAAQSFARSASTQIAREGAKILRNSLGGIIGGAVGDAIGGGRRTGAGRRARAAGSAPVVPSDDLADDVSGMLSGRKRP